MLGQNQDQLSHTYSILDAARIFGELDTAQQLQTNFLSLYMGQSEELLSSVAPYLFAYQPDSEFGKWLLEKGWGNSWGMFVETTVSLEDLRKHFRKFLLVKTEDGKELYFRFYDPRVLRIFLPTCDKAQVKEFFGPVKQFMLEDEDPAFALRYWLENFELKSARFEAKEGDLMRTESKVANGEKSIADQKKEPAQNTSSNSNSWID
ncbi:MAG: DUF4123 domain-containing protein [Flavobacteriales bacterium]|nr:DUF4123 domain-containing protein [Flavobacteriales bacterium]